MCLKMLTRILVVLNLLIIFSGKPTSQQCDKSQNSMVHEGNVGQVGMFPWLGVLRVHLHQGSEIKIALTGLVLVKQNYALANADDIVRIPRAILKADSKAMFILKDDETWTCLVKDYMTHPEYEYSTYNTIAIVEFIVDEEENFPVTPICWLLKNYNASNNLYAIGYTDENQLLEKTVYGMEYLSRSDCEEFYSRSGLIEEKHAPNHYHCSFSRHKKEHCVWENGMVLVSNNTGTWKLIGFGIRGPGCAAPARFIDLTHYYHWIHSSTSMDYEIYRRKTAFDEGFKKPLGEFDEIPAHQLVYNSEILRSQASHMFSDPYSMHDVVTVDRLGRDALSIAFHDKYEKNSDDCLKWDKSIIALYDLYFFEYNCVTLRIDSLRREEAYIWYKLEMVTPKTFPETPKEIIKHYPFNPSVTDPPSSNGSKIWVPHDKLHPLYLTDEQYLTEVSNINLYVKFKYYERATFKLEIFGPKRPKEQNKKIYRSEKSAKNIRRFEKMKNKLLRWENIRYEYLKLSNESTGRFNEMLKSKTNCNESVKNCFSLVFTVQLVLIYEKYFCN